MASSVHSDQKVGRRSVSKRSLFSLSDEVLMMTLINLTLDERIGIERTSKRIKVILDRILSQQTVFAVRPRLRNSVLMKSWSPLQSRMLCSKGKLHYDTLPWLGESSSLSVLSRCSSVKFVNLERVHVHGSDLATWCPLITHFVTDSPRKAAEYVWNLIRYKKDVLIESLECLHSTDADFSFLSNCSRLDTLCLLSYSNIPPNVLSRVKTLSFSVDHEKLDNLLEWGSENVEQLTIRFGSLPDRLRMIADNFHNLVHLDIGMRILDFNQLIKLKNIQSIKAWSSYLNQENIDTFEQFLSANGGKLKYLRIEYCHDDVIERGIKSLSVNCPNLICFKIENGIKLNGVELETIKLLPPLEKINLNISGLETSQDVEKVEELLLKLQELDEGGVTVENRCRIVRSSWPLCSLQSCERKVPNGTTE